MFFVLDISLILNELESKKDSMNPISILIHSEASMMQNFSMK